MVSDFKIENVERMGSVVISQPVGQAGLSGGAVLRLSLERGGDGLTERPSTQRIGADRLPIERREVGRLHQAIGPGSIRLGSGLVGPIGIYVGSGGKIQRTQLASDTRCISHHHEDGLSAVEIAFRGTLEDIDRDALDLLRVGL